MTMSNTATAHWQLANPQRLAKQFSLLGWIGFWMQVAMVAIPIALLIYVLFFSSPETAQRRGIELTNYMSYGGLAVMLFTILWFYRYTRLAKRIVDPESRPARASLIRALWIGLWASSVGIAFSMVLMMNAVWRMLMVLLATPQTGLAITAPMGGDPVKTLSALDAMSMTVLLVILTAELILLAFSLWLLFRVTRPSAEDFEVTDDADLGAYA
jgi:hypothetical protein